MSRVAARFACARSPPHRERPSRRCCKYANEASSPSYCVSDLSLDGERDRAVERGRGRTRTAPAGRCAGKAAPPKPAPTERVGLGALVQMRLPRERSKRSRHHRRRLTPRAPTPVPFVPSARSGGLALHPRQPATPGSRSSEGTYRSAQLAFNTAVLPIELSCPRGTGAEGCRGLVRVRMALRARARRIDPTAPRGRARDPYRGRCLGTVVTIALSRSARRALHKRDNRLAWVVAAMRDPRSGAVTSGVCLDRAAVRRRATGAHRRHPGDGSPRPRCAFAVQAATTTTVSLRVEGAAQTLYDGSVSTMPGVIDGSDGSGSHAVSGRSDRERPRQRLRARCVSAGISWQGSLVPRIPGLLRESHRPRPLATHRSPTGRCS